jgi:tRNA (cytidine/uridine-2'-O-)-methyltransferase
LACPFEAGSVLLFGRESQGLPDSLVAAHGAFRIPLEPTVRSLNLANAVAVVAYRALSKVEPSMFEANAQA